MGHYCSDCGGTGAAENGYECGGCWGAGWVAVSPPAEPNPSQQREGYERDAHYMGITASEGVTLAALKALGE